MGILWFIVGMMLGLIITSIVVACDWHEHPKRERSRWMRSGNSYICLDCFYDNNRPTDYCPHCGAKMTCIDLTEEELPL